MKKYNSFKSFTLAEVMIVVAILGVVAVITVSTTVKRHFKTTEMVKVKKAIAAYDTAISRMIVEQEIKSDDDFRSWAGNNENGCANSSKYFKIAESTDNNCRFKTTDGVWWDIDDILKPKIALKSKEDLDKPENPTTFRLKAYFDSSGIMRINDLQDALNNPNVTEEEINDLKKLQAFIDKAADEKLKLEKMKDAESQFRDVANIYMVENEKNDIKDLAGSNCADIGSYFNVKSQDGCNFVNSDGTYWQINEEDGTYTVSDSKDNPTYTIKMGVCADGTVNCQSEFPDADEMAKRDDILTTDQQKREKMDNSISQFNDVAEIYMAENDSKNINDLADSNCSNIGNYFKTRSQDGCNFVNSDGTYWQINQADGTYTVSDRKDNPTYTVKMGVCADGTINCQSEYPEAYTLTHKN